MTSATKGIHVLQLAIMIEGFAEERRPPSPFPGIKLPPMTECDYTSPVPMFSSASRHVADRVAPVHRYVARKPEMSQILRGLGLKVAGP